MYCVAYAFEVEGPAQASATITRAVRSASLYRRYEVGDAVPIRYLEGNPGVAMVDAPAHPARS